MGKEFIRTDKAPKPAGPYSQGIATDHFMFIAGQGPANPATGKMEATIEQQTRRTILNVKAILEAGGYSLNEVVKVGVYLKNGSDFQKMNQVYQEFFQENRPVRTTIVAQFMNLGMLVEIDAIAYKD